MLYTSVAQKITITWFGVRDRVQYGGHLYCRILCIVRTVLVEISLRNRHPHDKSVVTKHLFYGLTDDKKIMMLKSIVLE